MLIEFIVIAIILYLISAYIPKPGPFQTVFYVVCVIIAINYLCLFLGKSAGPFPLHINW